MRACGKSERSRSDKRIIRTQWKERQSAAFRWCTGAPKKKKGKTNAPLKRRAHTTRGKENTREGLLLRYASLPLCSLYMTFQ